MMSSVVDEIMEKLKGMTLLEASELVKRIEETFDVDASAAGGGGMMMAPPAAGGGDAAEAVEEKTEFDVILESYPADKKMGVLKAVREITGLGLMDCKKAVEAVPFTVKENTGKADADDIQKKIVDAGGVVNLK
jgi:large subunit ribosomal protein L7/L12